MALPRRRPLFSNTPALGPLPHTPKASLDGPCALLVGPQVLVAQKVTTGVYKGVTTSELDELAAETAASMTASHPDYALVSRLRWWPRPVHAVLLAMLLGLLTWRARKTTASSLHSRCS